MDLGNLSLQELIKYIEAKILAFSTKREDMETGINYYNYRQDIDEKMRMVIGEGGKLREVRNLPNTKIKDNQYSRALDQKRNYILSDTPNINTKNTIALDYLTKFLDKRFMRTLNKLATDSYNTGIAWLYLYTDGKDVKYKRVNPLEVIPIWEDDNKESLKALILFTTKEVMQNEKLDKESYIYFYTTKDIKIFKYNNGRLEFDEVENYLEKNGKTFDYGKIPFVYFKQPNQLPLINKVRGLQDALNLLLSNYADNMFENPMNSILVLRNYDGQDLGEFRKNLSEFRAIKVRDTAGGGGGGIDTLEVEVNSENYKVIIEMIKKAISQNARSLYLDNDRTSNAPNTLNIKAMYSDMELDANDLELEMTASFEYLFSFINQVTNIDFDDVDIRFKRNIMMNDESVVEMIRNSQGIVSNETLRANHPFVTDLVLETERLEEQKKQEFDYFNDYRHLGGDYGILEK